MNYKASEEQVKMITSEFFRIGDSKNVITKSS